MSRERKGTTDYIRTQNGVPGHFRVRVTLNSGDRSPWIDLKPTSDSPAFKEWAESEAARISKRAKDENLTLADFGVVHGTAPTGETCAEYFARWVAARQASGVRTTRDDKGRWKKWLAAKLDARPIAAITTRELEQIVSSLDVDVRAGKLSWKTAVHVWGLVTKLFDDARRSKDLSLRVRQDNPARDVRGPDRGDHRASSYVFPTELAVLLSCEKIAQRRRRLYAFAIYTGLRAGEIRALDWSDVHEDEGFIHVHRAIDRDTHAVKSTKTGHARKVPIEPALLPMLAQMRLEGGEGRVFARIVSPGSLPAVLRWDLEAAEVTRAELHNDTPTTRKLDFHDLRHTYGTWRAIRGDDVVRIRFAMGHTDLQTTQRYINEAQAWGNHGTTFGPLPETLLRRSIVSESSATDRNLQKHREKAVGRAGLEGEIPHTGSEELAPIEDDEPSSESALRERNPAIDGAADDSLTFADVTDAQIENAIVRAMLDGRGGVAEALAATLMQRRHAATSNVVRLDTKRRGSSS